jgi:hypothetical protein
MSRSRNAEDFRQKYLKIRSDYEDTYRGQIERIRAVSVGVLGLLIVGGGISAIVLNAVSETKINIAGMSISTGHVGVAFVGLGIIMVIIVFRQILSIIFKLAELPDDRPSAFSG